MDPISATLILLAAIGVTTRAAGGGVAHAAAAIKGSPSPTVQKWEAREAARQARGEQPRQRPGGLRTAWDNALSEWSEKQGHKHLGRMEAIREMSADTQGKARNKLLRKAQRRATLAGTVSKWGHHSKDSLQKVAEDVRQVLDDKRAERAVRRGDAEPEQSEDDRRQQAIDVVTDVDTRQGGQGQGADEGQDADILEFPRDRRSGPDQPGGDSPLMITSVPDPDGGPTQMTVRRAGPDEQLPDDGPQLTGNPDDPSTWRGTDSYGRDIQTGRGPSRQESDGSVVHDHDTYRSRAEESPERQAVLQQQYRKQRAQEGENMAVQSVEDAERAANWVRGNHRRIPEWSNDANQTWEEWHRGEITDAERDAMLARIAGIDPALANYYFMDAEDLSDWSDARPIPGESFEAHYGRRADYPKKRSQRTTVNRNSASSAEPGDQPAPEQNTTSENASTEPHGGNDMTAQQTQNIEITDLATGIQYASTVGGHLGRLGAKLGEDAQIAQNNAQGLRGQMQVLEEGKASLAALGFEAGQIQAGLDEAAELVPEAAQKLEEVATALPQIGEQLEQVQTAMAKVRSALEAQRSISEELDAKRSTDGVASSTKFYQEA